MNPAGLKERLANNPNLWPTVLNIVVGFGLFLVIIEGWLRLRSTQFGGTGTGAAVWTLAIFLLGFIAVVSWILAYAYYWLQRKQDRLSVFYVIASLGTALEVVDLAIVVFTPAVRFTCLFLPGLAINIIAVLSVGGVRLFSAVTDSVGA